MAKPQPQFGLVQLFLAVTAIGFSLTAIRAAGLAWYGLAAIAALLAGAAMLERSKFAGPMAFSTFVAIYAIRFVIG